MIIKVEGLVKKFGTRTILDHLDFRVDEGEFVALLGPNGAGKSTFLRILTTLSRPNSGRVTISGYRLPERAAAVRLHLGVVTHQPMLYGNLTAHENLRFFSQLYGLPISSQRIDGVIESLCLGARSNDLVRHYSRGMQQRLAIGRAIIHDPELLLLDEPHTGLDQDACELLGNLLRNVAADGRTVLITSHDLARVETLASRFDILSKGKISASTRREDLPDLDLSSFYKGALS